MRNKSVRETLRFLSEDAKVSAGDDEEALEIVDKWESEIIAYIEELERVSEEHVNALLKRPL